VTEPLGLFGTIDGFRPEGATEAAPAVRFAFDMKTRNALNAAWGNSQKAGLGRASEKKREEKTTRVHARRALRAVGLTGAELVPCIVVMNRLGAGRLDDDGLASALKKVRDGIAHELMIDDGSRFIRFRPRNVKAPPHTCTIEISIWRANVATMWGDDPR
jgi:hypothetical protein